jgi:hypothetical protein
MSRTGVHWPRFSNLEFSQRYVSEVTTMNCIAVGCDFSGAGVSQADLCCSLKHRRDAGATKTRPQLLF